MDSDVAVIGAGPAGVATAIASALKGFRVTIFDSRQPPIDKPCGEGLLPEAVKALETLGIKLNATLAFQFSGLRFSDEFSSASAQITQGRAFGLRRVSLHQLLVDRATELGVRFRWGARVTDFNSRGVIASGEMFPCKWIVGADGQHSAVRKIARIGSRYTLSRFGFRRHYKIPPWTNVVEVRWGHRCQMFVTPVSADEVCVALLSNSPQMRIDRALDQFPDVASRLRDVQAASAESGTVTALSCATTVARGNLALVGDASCTIDGIAGQGLSLAFQEAIHLADAFARKDLGYYKSAHRRVTRTAILTTLLLLVMDRSKWIRRKALRLFARDPGLFSRMISIHTGESSVDVLGMGEICDLGWRVISA